MLAPSNTDQEGTMPIDEVTIVRMCGECRSEIDTITMKKDNMRIFTDEEVWCPRCQANKPEIRDIAGRRASIRKEQQSYPANRPAR